MKKLLLILLTITGSINFTNAQWVQTSGPNGTTINCLAVSGTNIFAATIGKGIFLSNNDGSSWTPVNNGLTDTLATALAVSGTNVFAGTNGKGIFLSTNNGTN